MKVRTYSCREELEFTTHDIQALLYTIETRKERTFVTLTILSPLHQLSDYYSVVFVLIHSYEFHLSCRL